jgi:Cu/Ag efflux pump CusA
MKPTTKRENTDLSSLYDKIFNERMSTIQEQEEVDTGGAVAKATRIKAEVEELEKSGQEIPADVKKAEQEATKTIDDTVKDLKTTTNG